MNQNIKQQTINDLFQKDPKRFNEMHLHLKKMGIFLDYSKQNILPSELHHRLNSFYNTRLHDAIQDMYSGKKINTTENRSVEHIALRNLTENTGNENKPLKPEIIEVHQQMAKFVTAIHSKKWLGFTGKPIESIVNIGIGGSDLGPKMVVHALKEFQISSQSNSTLKCLKCYFVSNIDGHAIQTVLEDCNPETTLFVIASKSFSTQETLMNANTAKKWLLQGLRLQASQKPDCSKHFIAISSNLEKVKLFGIDLTHCLPMWDWVGGRYSLWSAIGLPIAIMIGMDHFKSLLQGAHWMDQHFLKAKPTQNMPMILAMLEIHNANLYQAQSKAVLPYDERLKYLTAYLQQADMESNGKSVTLDGLPIKGQTGAILWGDIGTNGQHAFHQLLHQGSITVPVDFIISKQGGSKYKNHHQVLMAHCLAQAQAFMKGKSEQEAYDELLKAGYDEYQAQILAKHKVIAGNKPSNILVLDQLTPQTLGSLLALYEHKIFTQGIYWNLNSFDQWGVELGKQLSDPILQDLLIQNNKHNKHAYDPSTQAMIHYLNN